jgi:hypothetical protein
MSLLFTDDEISFISNECEKLDAQVNENHSVVVFTEHNMALLKARLVGMCQECEELHSRLAYMLMEFNMDADTVRSAIGKPLTELPLFSLEEAVFAVLAQVTVKLDDTAKSQLPYENNINPTRH